VEVVMLVAEEMGLERAVEGWVGGLVATAASWGVEEGMALEWEEGKRGVASSAPVMAAVAEAAAADSVRVVVPVGAMVMVEEQRPLGTMEVAPSCQQGESAGLHESVDTSCFALASLAAS
jgi:hypothetical protein